jgi:phosphoketolase
MDDREHGLPGSRPWHYQSKGVPTMRRNTSLTLSAGRQQRIKTELKDDLDRFHLVQDVVDRLPHLGSNGAYLKQSMREKWSNSK